MLHRYWKERKAANGERSVVDNMYVHVGHTAAKLFVFVEGVRECLHEYIDCMGHPINGKGLPAAEVIGPYIIETTDVIEVVMCKHNGVDVHDVMREHLLTKVWRGIDDDRCERAL